MSFVKSAFLIASFALVRCDAVFADQALREISIMADAVYAAEPDTVQVLVSIEHTAQTAKDAEAAVEAKVNQLKAAFKQASLPVDIRNRARFLEPSPGPAGNWRPGSLVISRRTLVIESSSVSASAAIADLSLQKGADKILSIGFSVRNSAPVSAMALKAAATRAREKAEIAAAALGMSVGPLLSLNETVEPGAEVIRQRMELGESPGQFSDEQLHVVVTARFEVKPVTGAP